MPVHVNSLVYCIYLFSTCELVGSLYSSVSFSCPSTFINDCKGVRDDDYLRWLTSIALVLTKYYCLKKLSILHDLGVEWRHLIICRLDERYT
jgi:hypothetical protein